MSPGWRAQAYAWALRIVYARGSILCACARKSRVSHASYGARGSSGCAATGVADPDEVGGLGDHPELLELYAPWRNVCLASSTREHHSSRLQRVHLEQDLSQDDLGDHPYGVGNGVAQIG
jgi:hypothetical protein